jgi:hypothetical protein
MRELHEVREAGFTEAALRYPRGLFSLRLLCAFNGAPAGWEAPRGWRYYPNELALKAWAEVMTVAEEGGGPLDLARAYAPCVTGFANEPMRKAWERVHAAALSFLKQAEAV